MIVSECEQTLLMWERADRLSQDSRGMHDAFMVLNSVGAGSVVMQHATHAYVMLWELPCLYPKSLRIPGTACTSRMPRCSNCVHSGLHYCRDFIRHPGPVLERSQEAALISVVLCEGCVGVFELLPLWATALHLLFWRQAS